MLKIKKASSLRTMSRNENPLITSFNTIKTLSRYKSISIPSRIKLLLDDNDNPLHQSTLSQSTTLPKQEKGGGLTVKYTLTVIPDNLSSISQIHSPRIDQTENSPGGTKKPNYLMKSIFKTPSPKNNNNNLQALNNLQHNINSPLQQYFDLSSQKKRYDSFYNQEDGAKEVLSRSGDFSHYNYNSTYSDIGSDDNHNNHHHHYGFLKRQKSCNDITGDNDNGLFANSNFDVNQCEYLNFKSNKNFEKDRGMNTNNTMSMSNSDNIENGVSNKGNNLNCNKNQKQNKNVFKKQYNLPRANSFQFQSMQQQQLQHRLSNHHLNSSNSKFLNLGYIPNSHNSHLYQTQNQRQTIPPISNQMMYYPEPNYHPPNYPTQTSNMSTQYQPENLMHPPQQQYYQQNNSQFISEQLDDKSLQSNSYLLSKNQNGCRYLQKVIDDNPIRGINIIYPAILDNLIELTTDQFGNYLIQKFLDYLDENKLNQFMAIINPCTCTIGSNCYGTRVIQKLMDHLDTASLVNSFIIIFTPAIIPFIKDQNGIHIMQKFILMKNISFDFLFQVINPSIAEISTHRIGCGFVQKSFHVIKGTHLASLLDSVIKHTFQLVTNQYGNYVIQNVLLLKDQLRNKKIFDIVISNFYFFSKQKFASNVIEKFFEYDDLREAMISILVSKDNMRLLLLDNYGNYIVQKALSVCDSDRLNQLLNLIAPLLDQLKLVNFGQKLYQKLIIQYPSLSTMMFASKNSNRITFSMMQRRVYNNSNNNLNLNDDN